MKLGGFVIHGNNQATLGACLSSLTAICDEVVAVDSGSTDGSAALDAAHGVRRIDHPWRGYGAARATASSALAGCDYLLFLDSDEYFTDESLQRLRAWKASAPDAPAYSLRINDWAVAGDRRFVFRVHRRKRILGTRHARWTPQMIVHESISGVPTVDLPITVEHRFAEDLSSRAFRNEHYALLWAIQAHAERRRAKPAAVQRIAHFLKNAVLEGGAWRGGLAGLKLSWLVSRYHARKHHYLRELRRGAFGDLVQCYGEGDLTGLFARVQGLMLSDGAPGRQMNTMM